MAARSSGVVWAAVAGRRQWQCQGVGSGASVDVGGGGGSGGGGSDGGRGEAAALALLGSCEGWAADALAHAACSWPSAAGWQGSRGGAAVLALLGYGSTKQQSCLGGGGRAALMAMSGRWRQLICGCRRQKGGQRRLLCLACIGWAADGSARAASLRPRAAGGGGSSACFAWFASGLGR
jgi:hypothetical protein